MLELAFRAASTRHPELELEHAPALGAPIEAARLEVLATPAYPELATELGVKLIKHLSPPILRCSPPARP